MSVRILIGDVREQLATLDADSVDCCVTSPPYWGLRDYGVDGQIGLESTLGEHLAVMVEVFRAVRRVLKPGGTCWINYGDCYATTPNGRAAADIKELTGDNRTFRDKPFSTIGPIYQQDTSPRQRSRRGRSGNLGNGAVNGASIPDGRIVAGGILKAKDLCMVPQRLFIALQEDGWWVRSILPWIKRNGMPESISDRPANSVEYVGFLTKSARYTYDAECVRRSASANTHARTAGPNSRANIDRVPRPRKRPKAAPPGSGIKSNSSFEAVMSGAVLPDRNFRNTDLFFDALREPWGLISDASGLPLALDVSPQAFREAHFATFPAALVEPLIRAGCPVGGLVLDPFGGAGTTGLVADRLQRDAILIELNPEYAAIADRRIAGERGGLFPAVEVAA